MAVDQYLLNLNEQYKAGKLSPAEYKEKYIAFSGGGKPTLNFDMWSSGYIPRTEAEKNYMSGNITQSQYFETKTNSPLINQDIYAPVKVPVTNIGGAATGGITAGGSIIESGQADAIKKPNWVLILAVVIALLFID